MRVPLLVLLFCIVSLAQSQDLHYAKSTIELLSGAGLHGRGYIREGHKKAADFIAAEFEAFALQSFNLDFQQPFPINVNTFPAK